MFKNLLFVALGGALGSCSRYLFVYLAARLWPASAAGLGTLFVNLVGCFIIGCLLGLAQRTNMLTPVATLVLITGFCGGLTTFSTFSADAVGMVGRGQFLGAVGYVALSVAGGLALTVAGRAVAMRF